MAVSTAIYFDEDAYLELAERPKTSIISAAGPVGRHVAGKEFLTAYIRYAHASEFFAVARNPRHAKSLIKFASAVRAGLPPRQLRVFVEREFHDVFLRDSPAGCIHYPAPTDSRLAWTRQLGGGASYALSGITHTICTLAVMHALCEMVTAPFETFDALICISRASVATVKAVTDNYCAYLRDRFGGQPKLRPHLECIPLGVDTAKFRPATPAERADR